MKGRLLVRLFQLLFIIKTKNQETTNLSKISLGQVMLIILTLKNTELETLEVAEDNQREKQLVELQQELLQKLF